MDRSHRSRTIAMTVPAIVLAVVLAACGSPGASPTPAPTGSTGPSAGVTPSAAIGGPGPSPTSDDASTPTPGPSPAVDVAGAFRTYVTTHPLAADATISGEVRLGPATYAIHGTSTFDGPNDRQTLVIDVPGAPQTSESITVDGTTYDLRAGRWFVKTPPAATTGSGPAGVGAAIQSIANVTDAGVETWDGQPLHHLVPRATAPMPISAIGVDDPTGDGTVAFEFYAREDGAPVGIVATMHWTVVNGSTRERATMTMALHLSDLGRPTAIVAPQPVWATFTSKRFGYSLAYPSDWETHQSTGSAKPDTMLSADDTALYVYRYPSHGLSLNRATSGYVETITRADKAKVTSNVATSVAGLPARRLEWSATYHGTREWDVELVVVRGKYLYFFDYVSFVKTSIDDRTMVTAFVSSVTFPSANAGAIGSSGGIS